MSEFIVNERVRISIDEHIAEVTLDRADKLNAIDLKMFEALGEAADNIAANKTVRAVILRGAGGNFCAGIDLSVFAETGLDFKSALDSPVEPSVANIFQRAAYAWRELPMPVICAIEGVAFGGGMQIALGADIRYATPDARMSIMESKWGLIPDMAISTTLRHVLAPDRAKELAWTARVFDATEALAMGLVSAVAENPVAESRELARQCAARSPDAIRGIKRLVNQAWQIPEAEALALEARLQSGIIGGKNQLAAVSANLDKREAEFED